MRRALRAGDGRSEPDGVGSQGLHRRTIGDRDLTGSAVNTESVKEWGMVVSTVQTLGVIARRCGSRKFSYGSLDGIRHWRSFNRVHFVETPVFTKQITALLDDRDYRQLQVTLALKPAAGDLIRGSGGLRKIRWAVRGRGKSGGIRVIYYLVDEGEIYFLLAYAKNEQEDLDSRQLRVLRNLVKEEFE